MQDALVELKFSDPELFKKPPADYSKFKKKIMKDPLLDISQQNGIVVAYFLREWFHSIKDGLIAESVLREADGIICKRNNVV